MPTLKAETLRALADEALFEKCLHFVENQSSGEWGEDVEASDAALLVKFVRKVATAAALLEADKDERVAVSDQAIASSARRALGTWLAWPDAPRDGPVDVTNEQVESWLAGLPNALATAHPAPASNTTSVGETWRHKKRGTTYEKVGVAELQCANARYTPGEGDGLVIYRGEDGKLWARIADEFHDGRFERVPLAAIRSGSV